MADSDSKLAQGKARGGGNYIFIILFPRVGNFVNGMLAPLGGQADGGDGDGCLHTGWRRSRQLAWCCIGSTKHSIEFFSFILLSPFLRGLEVLAGGAVAFEGVVGVSEAGAVEGAVGDAVVAADGEAGLAAGGIAPHAALDERGMGGNEVHHVCLIGAEGGDGGREVFKRCFHKGGDCLYCSRLKLRFFVLRDSA